MILGAAREDKCDSVALLLAAGASTSITNTRGNTAIQESRGNVIHVFNVLSDQVRPPPSLPLSFC